MIIRSLVTLVITLCIVLGGSGCGRRPGASPSAALPPVGVPDAQGVVVKARASFEVSAGQTSVASRFIQNLLLPSAMATNPGTQPVTVVLAPDASMTMSSAAFVVPPITGDVLDFGSLAITALRDNNIRVCGAGGNVKCTQALFRVYTSGVAGSSLYNSQGGYGAPLTAGPDDAVVGLGPTGAAVVQLVTLTSNRNTVRLDDFTPAPSYQVRADFTDAGAGTYTTTINVEFALAP